MRRRILVFNLIGMLMLTGCGGSRGVDQSLFSVEPYDRVIYNKVTVGRGDLEPVITLAIKADTQESISYSVDVEDLEVESVNVSDGDKVHAGQVMVSFKSDGVKERIAQIQDTISQNEMLIAHYKKLMKIDKKANYKDDIKMLEADNDVARMEMGEEQAVLDRYSIIAKKDGRIIYVDKALEQGIITMNNNVIIENCGSDYYVAETKDDYAFETGTIYTAIAEVGSYDLELVEIEETADKKRLLFTPKSDMSGVSDTTTLTVQIKKDALHDVVYLEKSAIHMNGENAYVYVMDDNDCRQIVPVTIGEGVDDYVVVKSGLQGGEQVTVE